MQPMLTGVARAEYRLAAPPITTAQTSALARNVIAYPRVDCDRRFSRSVLLTYLTGTEKSLAYM